MKKLLTDNSIILVDKIMFISKLPSAGDTLRIVLDSGQDIKIQYKDGYQLNCTFNSIIQFLDDDEKTLSI